MSLPLLAQLQFVEELREEVVVFLDGDTSPLLLACEVKGSTSFPTVFFYLNNKPLPASSRLSLAIETPSCK